MNCKSAAILTVKDGDKMTKQGRKKVAAWIHRQANYLIKNGDKFASRRIARYLYTPGN